MRAINRDEIALLEAHGCECDDWSKVRVADDFTATQIKRVSFKGDIEIGSNCTLRDVSLIENYAIGNNVTIVNCGFIKSSKDATFAIGAEVGVVNEAGGREVKLTKYLSSSLAYIIAFYRYKPAIITSYNTLVEKEAKKIKGKAIIGDNCTIVSTTRVIDVRIEPDSKVIGVQRLENGYIMGGCIEDGVVADTFMIGKGAHVHSSAILRHAFVGQCAEVGAGFFAENTLIFANSQLLNGEAVAAFCGPYTVSHHKTSLLIAGAYSFFNAGSATNASNHHYKLGPSHQAIYERGVKTGSGSYILEPAHIGAYTMVIGHHKGHPDTSKFPFSYLVERNGESVLMIGQNLKTIGIFRDEIKWKTRDKRKGIEITDYISSDVFNPYIIQRMIEGIEIMNELYNKSEADMLMHEGVKIPRATLPRAIKMYEQVVEAYILNGLLNSLEHYIEEDNNDDSVDYKNAKWIDCGGFICPKEKIDVIEDMLFAGESLKKVAERLHLFWGLWEKSHYYSWCVVMAKKRYGLTPHTLKIELSAAAQKVVACYTDICNSMCNEAKKEFSGRLSVGYGIDSDNKLAQAEYTQIKGTVEDNPVIAQCRRYWEEQMKVAKSMIK